MTRCRALVVLGFLLFLVPAASLAQVADPDPARWAAAIGQFEKWDTQNAVPANPIVFVGSSSIVRWSTAIDFPGLPIVNRGFGGSHISDVNRYVDQTVLKYNPSLVVFYAGNNDIDSGKSAAQVVADYKRFVEMVLSRKPDTQILFISIHPSVRRWARWAEMRDANAQIKKYSDDHPALHYVDIAPGMLGADGQPMPHLFVEDGLHLTPAGYAVWNPVVARAIASIRSNRQSRR